MENKEYEELKDMARAIIKASWKFDDGSIMQVLEEYVKKSDLICIKIEEDIELYDDEKEYIHEVLENLSQNE